jgi:hypothetical protein
MGRKRYAWKKQYADMKIRQMMRMKDMEREMRG